MNGRALLLALVSSVALAAEPTPSELAAPFANAALDASYAEYAKRPKAIAPPHEGPWVVPARAQVSGSAKKGYSLSWTQAATAGFEYDVKVTISPKGEIKVVSAHALFSPD
jgi:hypothetical protein